MKPSTLPSTSSITFKPLIVRAWEVFKPEWGFFIITLLIFLLVETFDGSFGVDSPTGSFFVTLFSIIVSLILTVGFFEAIFNYIDTRKMNFETFFGAYKKPGKVVYYTLGYILKSTAIYGSSLLVATALMGVLYTIDPNIFTDIYLAIAGGGDVIAAAKPILLQLATIAIIALVIICYLSIRLHFVSFLTIDKNMHPLQAFQKSLHISKGKFWHIFLFNLFLFGFNLLGLFCLIVGIIITVPVSIIAYALFYRSIVQKHSF